METCGRAVGGVRRPAPSARDPRRARETRAERAGVARDGHECLAQASAGSAGTDSSRHTGEVCVSVRDELTTIKKISGRSPSAGN